MSAELFGLFDLGYHWNLETLCPLSALFLGETPGIALVFDSPESIGDLLRKSRLHKSVIAAHVDDSLDVLDPDRASLLAPSTGRATPDCRLARDLGDHVRPVVFRRRSIRSFSGLVCRRARMRFGAVAGAAGSRGPCGEQGGR